MKKKKFINKTELSKLMKDSIFNPREQGPMSVIIQMNDPLYCEMKAMELMIEARQEKSFSRRDSKIIQVITLLLLARLQRKLDHESKETSENKS